VLTLWKTNGDEAVSVPTSGKSIDDLLNKEWLLTNPRGGYASSTIVGCNTRRYHGLLIGSLNPPANRIMALANCLEMLILNGGPLSRSGLGSRFRSRKMVPSQNGNARNAFNLSTFEFNEKFAPEGFTYLVRFHRDIGVHFDYQLDKFKLIKSVYLLRDTDTVALVYDFTSVQEPAEFILRPFIGLRDFHALQKSYARVSSTWLRTGLLVRHDAPESCGLFLSCPSMNFEKDEQWWFNFLYRNDRDRGQDFTEDLWTPGFFKCRIDSPTKIVFWGNLSNHGEMNPGAQKLNSDIEAVREKLHRCHESIKSKAKSVKRHTINAKDYHTLCLAADQFISKRQTDKDYRTTILAGFPWFADWGRDAFVALPGLLLSTGRFDEAKSVLTTFAQAADDGLIPNRFDDRSGTAYFNSIDASLWFINAAFQYLNATDDSETFTDSFYNGTRFDTHADADGLITAGNHATQLTWMDAKYDGVAFTPRFGKAVEINALWYNSLCCLAQFYTGWDEENSKHYKSLADKVAAGFCQLFWNEAAGYLNDCILPDGSIDATLRPNQIFAVSLPFSPLPPHQQKAVVDMVQKELLTPYGLRTLSTCDSRYKGTYTGPQQQRDEAYHQGTVWPYLIGPFVESWLKVNGFSRKNKKKAAEFIQPLMQHLTDDGCLGQLCEIFDGNAPHKPKGCIAQAWSVAELIRVYALTLLRLRLPF
jgi:predicted glycogen debranching enzyme